MGHMCLARRGRKRSGRQQRSLITMAGAPPTPASAIQLQMPGLAQLALQVPSAPPPVIPAPQKVGELNLH